MIAFALSGFYFFPLCFFSGAFPVLKLVTGWAKLFLKVFFPDDNMTRYWGFISVFLVLLYRLYCCVFFFSWFFSFLSRSFVLFIDWFSLAVSL